jgi:hypothetical protein
MATLVLRAAGAALGGVFGPVGAAIGGALGGIAGASIDQALLGGETSRAGPRLERLTIMASTEGAPIPRLYGAMRLGGQVIWATELDEITTQTTRGAKGARQTTTQYSYRANVAVGLCEGPVASIRRIWADGVELDLGSVDWRLHPGTEIQEPDPLIIAKEGQANAPAYRGLAYVVFEGLELEAYGNRLPQLSFEVIKPVDGPAKDLRAINLIPACGEFVYEDRPVALLSRPGASETVNRHMARPETDFVASLEDLLATCPTLKHVALVVAWFGDDLRAGNCRIRPAVENAARVTSPLEWRVAGLTRESAAVLSTVDGQPAYGGTPTDASILRAIAVLRERGLAVTLYPFVMMDIPLGNALPDPWSGALTQPPYPWRGRITVSPAPGRPGTVDGTAAAASQIAGFFGTAAPAHFTASGDQVAYSGLAEWSYRRFIFHYARLAEIAGGVDSFVIGSELIGLTRVRSASGVYPAVGQLVSIAEGVRTILRAGSRIVYGADWTEYGAHVLEGGLEVRFPLDPLFASSAIDAVALDWYAPLTDWRDGLDHLDAQAGHTAHSIDYLAGNIAGGEGFDWYYASPADRLAQIRTPISDGAYGKPWVFRQKDLIGWWSNPHIERVGGVERPQPTAWVPKSKPIWLLEFGCPAVDKGANSPSAFPDPKSSENALPPFSNGGPDPAIQARLIEAVMRHWATPAPGIGTDRNPLSPLYGGPMAALDRLYAWAWDARPYPAFPDASTVWRDAPSYVTGHWLNGRIGALTLDRLAVAIAADFGVMIEASDLVAPIIGAVIDRPMSGREALEPLAALYGVDAVDRDGVIRLRARAGGAPTELLSDGLIEPDKGGVINRSRMEERDLPAAMQVAFADPSADYQSAVEQSRRIGVETRGLVQLAAGLAIARGEARRRVDIALQDRWIGRETVRFALPPSRLALEPGDPVRVTIAGRPQTYAITAITRSRVLEIEARRIEPGIFDAPAEVIEPGGYRLPVMAGRPEALLLDLPVLPGGAAALQWLAATLDPWPGALEVWRSIDGASFAFHRALTRPATLGALVEPLGAGYAGRWDGTARLVVRVYGTGDLVSRPKAEVLDGANLIALARPDGALEMVQFATARLIAPFVFELSDLLRGQLGTEGAIGPLPAGTAFVLVDEALLALSTSPDELGRPFRWRIAPPGRSLEDPSVVELAAAPGLASLKPYAPVQIRARREPAGIRLTFIRRTRTGGDGWEARDPPLGEDAERYEIDILAGAAVRRTIATNEPAALYALADELADFAAPQTRLDVKVFQISSLAGRGLPGIGMIFL